MSFEDTKILEFNQLQKSNKTPFITFASFESLIERTDGCKNKSSTRKLGKPVPCEYLMSMIRTFDGIENKHDVYRGEDCMRNFCESLRQLVMKTTNFERKKMMPLTKGKKRNQGNGKAKTYNICKNSSNMNIIMIKLKTIVTILLNTEVLKIAKVI